MKNAAATACVKCMPWKPATKCTGFSSVLEAFGSHSFHSPSGLTYEPLTWGYVPFDQSNPQRSIRTHCAESVFVDPQTHKRLTFLANNCVLPELTITQIYKSRCSTRPAPGPTYSLTRNS